jgi:2-polyprenyl-3-methyl-5-hydroxy-6-metoxy-1,4-benzoquinol methylase
MLAVESPVGMVTGTRACPLCEAANARVVLLTTKRSPTGEPYRMVECSVCRLRFTRPLPTVAELGELYGHEYYGTSSPPLLSWDRLRLVLHRHVIGQRHRALLDRRPGRILDVGCGDGDFLMSLKRRGWEVYGTEFSAAACALAQEKGIAVRQGDLLGAGFPAGFFDVVTFWHVLEHVPAPPAEMAEVRRILREDGLLVVEVPNSASPTLRICGEDWFPLGMPGHLQHFTAAVLERFMQHEGFVPIRRQDFHPMDAALSLMSFVTRLGILGRLQGKHYFVADYRRAAWTKKMLFLVIGFCVGLLCLPYYLLSLMVTRNGETVTITARKAGRSV